MQDRDQQRTPGQYGLDEIKANRLESWPNSHQDRDYITHFEIPEFTCLCPRSGFPDFATIIIDYVPDKHVVEFKSLKLYINGYRDRQISMSQRLTPSSMISSRFLLRVGCVW